MSSDGVSVISHEVRLLPQCFAANDVIIKVSSSVAVIPLWWLLIVLWLTIWRHLHRRSERTDSKTEWDPNISLVGYFHCWFYLFHSNFVDVPGYLHWMWFTRWRRWLRKMWTPEVDSSSEEVSPILPYLSVLFVLLVIGDFRVAFRLCFKASPSAKPFIWKLVKFTCKWTTVCVWIKLISIWKASH